MKIFKRGFLTLLMWYNTKKEKFMNILLIEDNLTIIKGLVYALEKNNYEVTYKTKGYEALDYIKDNNKIDLIILDITLGDINGFHLYENYIKEKNIPTIFLTAQDEEEAIVKGLDMGAEDYITKPFSTKELISRVNKIVNRNKRKTIIQVDDITYDLDKMLLYKNDKKIELTALELKLVNLLFTNINKVVRRNTILDKIWEWTGNDVDDHTITVYFKRIREKIKSDIIITIKGVGYRIDEK